MNILKIKYLVQMDATMNDLMTKINEGIVDRMTYKYDAYFDLPENINTDQIKELIKYVSELNINDTQIYARLYTPNRLQVFWDTCPRRSNMEYLCNLPIIMDPKVCLQCYEKWNTKL